MSLARDLMASVWEAECRKDLDGLLANFLPDGEFHPTGKPPRRGHAAIRDMTEEFYASFPDLEVDIIGDWGDGEETAAIEFRARMRDGEGNEFVLQGVNVVEVEDGKIKVIRAYEEEPSPVSNRGA